MVRSPAVAAAGATIGELTASGARRRALACLGASGCKGEAGVLRLRRNVASLWW
jgi:hypothetical protein